GMDTLNRGICNARLQQPLDATSVRLAAAERTYIEAARLQRGLQRRIVDLGVVRERGKRAESVERPLLQDLVGPAGIKGHVRKALGRGKGGARVDDLHVEAGDRGHRGE